MPTIVMVHIDRAYQAFTSIC